MKIKFGFTLAEVLITLAIIGVTAAISIPILTSDSRDKQYITQFKKAFAMLTTAGITSEAEDDFGYADLTSTNVGTTYDADGEVVRSLYALLASKTNVIDAGTVADMGMDTNVNANYETHAILFADGTALLFNPNKTTSVNNDIGNNVVIYATIDVNGSKGPNTYTVCNSAPLTGMMPPGSAANPYSIGSCTDNNLNVADRFTILIKEDGKVYPGDPSVAYVLKH